MRTIQMKTRTEDDGRLAVTIPTPLPAQEVEVTVTYRPAPATEALDDKGRPAGWIDRTYGSIPELERPPQEVWSDREEW